MTKNDPRKALGKGLHALLPARNTAPTAAAPEPAPTVQNAVLTVSIQHVAPNPAQPRRDFEPAKLLELTRSIEQDGIIQPIIVRKSGATEFQIIAGERRWRAAKAAGLTEVPVIVKPADDQQALELALVENIQREDLNPIELATAFYRMASELGMSHDQIGAKTGKERTTITNAVRLLQLPTNIQSMVSTKQLSPGHARALLKFEDEATQLDIATRCVAEGWSVRQIEDFTRKPASERKAKTKPIDAPLDPNVKFAVSELERVLGTRVRIVERTGGAGKIEIDYYSADDLSRVYDQIVGELN
jgi:ParB family transcriptional regulator, chromosome partitioning protein